MGPGHPTSMEIEKFFEATDWNWSIPCLLHLTPFGILAFTIVLQIVYHITVLLFLLQIVYKISNVGDSFLFTLARKLIIAWKPKNRSWISNDMKFLFQFKLYNRLITMVFDFSIIGWHKNLVYSVLYYYACPWCIIHMPYHYKWTHNTLYSHNCQLNNQSK